ncbi:hypothetical protein [Roseovarius aestuariivivens]|uniref:hypothetical protein n=1 Tax=Roseovarius aestuariivivens TaxID=1888910 RepID=UPI001081782E|nr:hypothetical protein [Roseovarius aestuariivivens]
MTLVITRLFEDETTARKAFGALRDKKLPPRDMRIVQAQEGESAEALEKRLGSMDVVADAVGKYAKKLAAGGKAVLVVNATSKPLGAARITRETLAKFTSVDIGVDDEENYVPDRPTQAASILDRHPHILFSRLDYTRLREAGPISRGLGPKLLMKQRPRTSAIHGGAFMSKKIWPMPLLKEKKSANSAMRGGRYMSKAFWPMPLLSRKERSLSVIRGGALPMTRGLGLDAVIRR